MFHAPTLPHGQHSPDSVGGGIPLLNTVDLYPSNNPFSENELRSQILSPPVSRYGIQLSQCTPALLDSPSRSGHGSKMKQIFENARKEQPNFAPTTQNPSYRVSKGKYPKITTDHLHVDYFTSDNVCPRHGQPIQSNLNNQTALPGLGASVNTNPNVNTSLQSTNQVGYECSTPYGSWSGDSDYLISESARRSRTPKCPDNEPRIENWLASVSIPYSTSSSNVSSPSSASQNYSSSGYQADRESKGRQAITRILGRRRPRAIRVPSSYSADGSETPLTKEVCVKFSHQRLRKSPSMASPTSGGISLGVNTPTQADQSKQTKGDSTPEQDDTSDIESGLSPLSSNVCIQRGHRRLSQRSAAILRALGHNAKIRRLYHRPPSSSDGGGVALQGEIA